MSYLINRMRLKVSILVHSLLFFQVVAAQNFTELDEIATQKQKQLKTEVVITVANKDTIIFNKDSKLFSAQRGQAPIGSTSEWLTTALVLMLVDEGKISLDDNISRYLNEFERYGKNYITIRHCLTHFMGVQTDAGKLRKAFEKKKFASLEEEVKNFASKEIQTNPGEEFRYTNMGFNVAGRLLEVVMKKKFDMVAQQKLFRPLGMRQTNFSSVDGTLVDPSAGARSSAGDLIRFMTMLLNNGVYKGQRILSEKSVSELRRIHVENGFKNVPGEVNGFVYALGAWSPEQAGKQASTLTVPSGGGTIPVIDFCRGYAFVYLLKDFKEDQKASAYSDIKAVLDNKFPSKCK